jgi:predicted ribosome quality control (RQC) complex YloA/Tae2 family protein
MYRNYYLFKRQVEFLNQELKGASITDCYSHRKDELVLDITGESKFLLRIGVHINLPYLVLFETQNIRDPKVSFFPKILDQTINELRIEKYDKIIYLSCGQYKLEMIFFGKNSNIYLIDETNKIITGFKKKNYNNELFKHDIILDPTNINFDSVLKMLKSDRDRTCESFISNHLGGFNQLLAREVCHRSQILPTAKINTIPEPKIRKLIPTIEDISKELQKNTARIYFHDQKFCIISLVDLGHINDTITPRYYNSINEAWKKYLNYIQRQKKLDALLGRIRFAINKRINYLKRALKNIREAENLEAKKKEAEIKGNLLLTYASKLEKGIKEVELKNIFSDDNKLIKIKLNPARSIPENARRYFDKYKNISEKKEQIVVKKDTYQSELDYWLNLSLESKNISTVKQAEKLYSTLINKKLLQSPGITSFRETDDLAGSFHRLLLGRQWEVFIGKNSRNNDLLTFKYAHKFDLWFHAQGVSGSHVIIRLPKKDQMPPREIIEQAASTAAYFSAAKHSSTVPVNYTYVRYVHKPRKASPGTVVISNEKTIFVEPRKYI